MSERPPCEGSDRRRARAWLGLLLLMTGCTFEQASEATLISNRCDRDSDCTAAVCVQGMCVSDGVPPLVLSLEVTPPRTLDGSEPYPVLLGSFKVEGTTERGFAMPRPFTLAGSVMNAGAPVAADLRFIDQASLPQVQAKSPQASTLVEDGAMSTAGEFEVALLEDSTYTLEVVPSDTALPPLTIDLVEGDDEPLRIDYAELPLWTQRVVVSGAPDGVTLRLRARDEVSAKIISSSVPVVDSEGTLTFAEEPGAYVLEIVPKQDYAADAPSFDGLSGCDASAPTYPNLTVHSTDMVQAKDGSLHVELPEVPRRIKFAGSVELCPDALDDTASVASLPMSLRASQLQLPAGPVVANTAATTTANYDEDSRTLRFCAELLPGTYEIVITPPTSVACAIYAEQQSVMAPESMPEEATGILFSLPGTSYISGTLQTPGLEGFGGVSIEALALGVSEGIEIDVGDSSVTRYNRSRQGTTDSTGMFRMPLDLGAYDLVFKPGSDSGFGWLVNRDVKLARRDFVFENRIALEAPILVQGVLRYSGGDSVEQSTLDGAEVRAFTVLDGEGTVAGRRAVQVGKAVANEDGRFKLLITPTLPSGW